MFRDFPSVFFAPFFGSGLCGKAAELVFENSPSLLYNYGNRMLKQGCVIIGDGEKQNGNVALVFK
jgi:hypothetical protein